MGLSEMDARLISQGTQVESVDGGALIPVATAEGQPQGNITLENLAGSLASAVPAQQTEEQVSVTGLFAKTEDGKMVELTKESVASVVAGLMGANRLFPFMDMGSITDIDSIKKSGFYSFNLMNDDRGYIEKLGYQWGQVIHFQNKEDWGTFQILLNNKYGDNRLFYRNFVGGVWTNFIRLDNFGYNSLAELSAGVAGQIGVTHFSKWMGIGEEFTVGDGGLGLIVISSNSSGHCALYLMSAYNVILITETGETFRQQFEVTKSDSGVKVKNISSVERAIEVNIIANKGRS